jgi:cell division protein FtsL
MASLSHAQAHTVDPVAHPRPRARRKAKAQPRARGGILWIAVSGILLGGVVFVNVLVLQLNLSLDSANSQRSKLLAQNAALQSQYSALISSPRIESQAAKELGLVYEDPSDYGHIDVSK